MRKQGKYSKNMRFYNGVEIIRSEYEFLVELETILQEPIPKILQNDPNNDFGYILHWKSRQIIGLSLGDKNLCQIPRSIKNLILLEFLDISHNRLTYIPESITELNMLKVLDLSHNLLTHLPRSIGLLKQLKTLKFSSNCLTSLPHSIWKLSCLNYLDLSNNNISSLSEAMIHAKIFHLDLSRNCFTQIPKILEKVRHLSTLNISSMKTSIDLFHLLHFPHLTKFYASSLQLTSIPEFLVGCPKLVHLDLSNNLINNISFSWEKLPFLSHLSVVNNLIQNLPEDPSKVASIGFIDLQMNLIRTITPLMINFLKIKKIKLSGNLLTEKGFQMVEERNLKTITSYYEKTTVELAYKFLRNEDSLTLDERSRLVHEADSHIRELIGSSYSDNHPIVKLIDDNIQIFLNKNPY